MTKRNKASNQNNQSSQRRLLCNKCAKVQLTKKQQDNSLRLTVGERIVGTRMHGLFKNSSEALDHNRRRGKGDPDVVMVDGKLFVEY